MDFYAQDALKKKFLSGVAFGEYACILTPMDSTALYLSLVTPEPTPAKPEVSPEELKRRAANKARWNAKVDKATERGASRRTGPIDWNGVRKNKPAKLSKKRLFEDLAEFYPNTFEGVREQGLKHTRISDETYGRNSCIYVYCKSPAQARRVRTILDACGHKIGSYGVPHVIEVSVTYFKGWHHDE